MKEFDNVIVGFGKGGKTLAGALAKMGQTVALIERSEKMFGGTCINLACIPSKALEHSARISHVQSGGFDAQAERYRQAILEKRALVAALRQKNYEKAVSAGVAVLVGEAAFLDDHILEVKPSEGAAEQVRGERIFLNTGARPFLPPIPGLDGSHRVYLSETMTELEELPRRLVIIGGGYIGLEFASYYANFGSRVTVIQDGEVFIPREDREVAAAVLASLNERGVQVLFSGNVRRVWDEENHTVLTVALPDGERLIEADAVLVATGRRPNLEGLHPERAGIALTQRGAVQVDRGLRTTVPHIWGMGDVAGGLQFTYISLDDSRIVLSQLMGGGERTTENRGHVPYSVFLDPPMSRVGMTEEEARRNGFQVQIARLPAAAVPDGKVLRQSTGLLKAVVDGLTGRILGAHLFCAQSHEMINLVKLAMDAGVPYTVLRDSIYTHPTMSEALNDLFAALA